MRRTFGRAAVLLFLASATVSVTMHACKEPTQVTIDIRTLGFKCNELRKINVVVAATPEAAEEKWQFPQGEVGQCKGDYEVGTLVITPAGGSGAVIVLASYTDEPCKAPDYLNCIVARRQFTFIEHVPLRLPITLEASCKNVPCNALSSCRSGLCVGSTTDCADDGTCAAPAEPVVAADGATILPPADATLDIAPNDAYVPPDTYVPRSDAYVPPTDGSSFDAPPGDGSNPSDGGGPSGSGNACPTSPAGPDCKAQNSSYACCAQQNLTCQPSFACDGGPYFECTGRLHCGGGWCCGAPGGPPAFGQSSACSQSACPNAVYLCTTNTDCPPGQVCGMYVYTGRGNGAIFKCGLSMVDAAGGG